MSTVKDFIKRHPLTGYFALTFTISWGGLLCVVGGAEGIPGTPEETARLLPLAVLMIVAGPSVAGLLFTGLVHGRRGFHGLRSRLLTCRVGLRWYAIALLTTPVVALALLFALSLSAPEFIPGIFVTADKGSLLLSGLLAGLVAGIFEEIGWTGFAIPMLRQRRGVLATGLIVGFLWGAWHYIVAFWGSGDELGAFTWLNFLPHITFYVAVLPAYRLLMVWVYDRTASLLIAMLMHASLTACTTLILMPVTAGVHLSMYYLALAAAFWILCAAVLRSQRRTVPDHAAEPA
jgi:membrane protease YdiL (CAAX protease family)